VILGFLEIFLGIQVFPVTVENPVIQVLMAILAHKGQQARKARLVL
jgi:hypothetical protein